MRDGIFHYLSQQVDISFHATQLIQWINRLTIPFKVLCLLVSSRSSTKGHLCVCRERKKLDSMLESRNINDSLRCYQKLLIHRSSCSSVQFSIDTSTNKRDINNLLNRSETTRHKLNEFRIKTERWWDDKSKTLNKTLLRMYYTSIHLAWS